MRMPGSDPSRDWNEAAARSPAGTAPFSGRNDQPATIQSRAPALDRLVEEAPRCLGFPDSFIQFLNFGVCDRFQALACGVAVRQ